MARKTKIGATTRSTRGLYQRDIGCKLGEDGRCRQHRFYLGRDQGEAAVRSIQLERAWAAVESIWQKAREEGTKRMPTDWSEPGPRPVWDEVSLAIGQAIAAGGAVVRLELPRYLRSMLAAFTASCPPVDGKVDTWLEEVQAKAGEWVRRLQAAFPMIRVELVDESAGKVAGQAVEAVAGRLEEQARQLRAFPSSGQTLHQAIAGYVEYVKGKYKDPSGTGLSLHGGKCVRQAGLLESHHENIPLDRLNLTRIEGIIDYWANRPQGKRGRIAAETASSVIDRFRDFMRWLHRSPDFDWLRPGDYEVRPVKIRVTPEELSARMSPARVPVYGIDELAVLWEYARPLERALMVLALNTGSGIAELSGLLLSEIHLDQPHGHYDRTGSWIKRVRYKTAVYGEWLLWPETVRAIGWLMTQRPENTTAPQLLLTGDGQPLTRVTRGGNRGQRIPNLWNRLLDRVVADVPGFRRLSFNKLRKSGSQLVRKAADGEAAAVHICHGQPVKGDPLAERYSNRDFERLFDALALVRDRLEPVFSNVADPFPQEPPHKYRLPLSKVKRIQELRTEGHKVAAIARMVGCHRDAVILHSKAPKEG